MGACADSGIDDGVCAACVEESCCTELEACIGEPLCACVWDCVLMGGDNPTCVESCSAGNSVVAVEALTSCHTTTCGVECEDGGGGQSSGP